ncbi:TonB-dependent receptor [Massilia sp. ZL223]|nr:TonB-dependent receptor [Massilia sp. ZL223]
MFASGMAVAASAYAQEAPQAPAEGQLQRVEVTGSRIPMANLEGTSPVTVVSAQEIKMDGVRSVENLLNNLPQVFADQGGTISNGSSGTATVNLRNFGADRTLVLVNGRRLPAGSPSNTAADLNQIPAPLIKRVEVLTGGASAVYGSDAVAGVVNFIMNDKFQGAQIELNHSFYNHQQNNGRVADATRRSNYPLPGDKGADGKISDANLLLGGNFADNRGNVTVFFNYKKEDALLQSERDYSACALGGTEGNTFNCGGSYTSFPGLFVTDGGDLTVADANGGVRPFADPADLYNYGPLNYFQRPSERYGFNAFAHYNINDNTRLYTEASFHDDHTVAQIAPSGIFGLTVPVSFENPFLSSAWRSALGLNAPGDTADVFILRRNVEGGGRQDNLRHTSFRGVVGLKGDIGNWNYDVFGQMGKVLFQENYLNDFSNTRLQAALDVVADASGAPVCRSGLAGCVPYNIWALGKVTPQMLEYLQTPGFQKGYTSQSVIGANVGTNLSDYGWTMPGTEEGIGVNFGFEHRTEKLERTVDTAFATGDLAGQGGPTQNVGGEYSVKDYFAEARIPLLSKKPFADDLSLNASYRRSDYNTGYKTNSYGLGLEWAPMSLAKVRASYQRAVRAANVVEMFTPVGLGLYDNDEDPCAGATPSATLEQCARTGVTAAQYGNIRDNAAGQYNALFGGNADLKPETAKTYTVGLVLTPMRNLSLTLDYFNMKVEDVISALPATTTLNDCLETGNPAACSLIQRDSQGSLWMETTARIIANNQNLGMRKTSGLDVAANFRQNLGSGLGSLDFAMTGTWLKEFLQEDAPGKGAYDCAGLFGPSCGTPLPEWRHKLRVTWSSPWRMDLALTWRFIDEVKLSSTSSDPQLKGNFETGDATFGRQNYLDLAASWQATKWLALRAGINNLLDKDPPVGAVTSSTFGNGNTFPQVYDALGRRVFLNLTAKF